MKKRPLTLTIAALIMVTTLLAGYSIATFFPRLGLAATTTRITTGASNGTTNLEQGGPPPGDFGGNLGGNPQPGAGNPPSSAPSGGRPTDGGFGGGPGGGVVGGSGALGSVTNTNNTSNIALIAIQTGLRILSIGFVGLGLVAALGLFKLKRWGLVLTVALFVIALIGFLVPQNTLLRLVMPVFGISNRAGAGVTLSTLFTNFRFNWVNLIEPLGLLIAVVLALLPNSRQALKPIDFDDLPDEIPVEEMVAEA